MRKTNYKDCQLIILKNYNIFLSDKTAKKIIRLAKKIQRCREIECNGFYEYNNYHFLKKYYTQNEITKLHEAFDAKWEKAYIKTKENIEKLFKTDEQLTMFDYDNGSGDPRGSAFRIKHKEKDEFIHIY